MGPTPASEPFNDPNNSADVIIRSSDKVDFYVHKLILGLASPFFRDMFSLTQPIASTTSQGDTGSADNPPVIDVTENGKTLDRMLRFIYPVAEPPPGTLGEVGQVLEASLKYQVDKIVIHAKKALRTFIDKQPLQVYAVACRLNLEEEAHFAACTWKVLHLSGKSDCTCLGTDSTTSEWSIFRSHCEKCRGYMGSDFASTIAGEGFPKEMETTNAESYYRLVRFARYGERVPFCNPKSSSGGEEGEVQISPIFARSDADLILKSSDGGNFRVHKLLLSMASAQSILNKVDEEAPTEDDLPVVQLDEKGVTLSHLLRFCYPFHEDRAISLPQSALVRVAAEKYALPNVTIQVRKQMMEDVKRHPIQAYFLFRLYGWEEDTQEALKECLKLPTVDDASSYVPEMEQSPSAFYHDLLKAYHDERWKSRTTPRGRRKRMSELAVPFLMEQVDVRATAKKRKRVEHP